MKKTEILNALIEAFEATVESLDQMGFSVDDCKDEFESNNAADSARLMARLEYANELADTLKKTVGKVYDWSRMSLVPNKFEAEGLDLLRLPDVGRVQLTADINVSVLDKNAQFTWLSDNGHEELITETVNASTLKALLRRKMKGGEEIPEQIFKVTAFTRASITKS